MEYLKINIIALLLIVVTGCSVATTIDIDIKANRMCDKPHSLKLDTKKQFYSDGKIVTWMDVPCGKCPPCKAATVKAWVFRLEQEANHCDSAHFVTLTYKDAPRTETGSETLLYKDIQTFFKDLRKRPRRSQKPIKYFCVGEYGSQTYRPHWHLIIFNAGEQEIRKSWRKGIPHVGESVKLSAMRYILNYLQKPKYDEIKAKYPLWDGAREMRHMSKGLGQEFLNDLDTYKQYGIGNLKKVALSDGKELRLPRYYRDQLYGEEMRQYLMEEAYIENQQKLHDEIAKAERQGRDYPKEQRMLRQARIKHNSRYALKLRDPYEYQE